MEPCRCRLGTGIGYDRGSSDLIKRIAATLFSIPLGLAGLAQGPRKILADLRDPVLSAFPPLAVIIPMMLGAALATAEATRPGGASAYAVVVIVLITAFIAGIAVRTAVAVIRGQLPGADRCCLAWAGLRPGLGRQRDDESHLYCGTFDARIR